MNSVDLLKSMIQESNAVVVFTGAGISTESGISDYRSKGGLWERFKPVTFQEFLASEEGRARYWAYKFELMKEAFNAKPNEAHAAIVRLEKSGKLCGVITQNIDGLHQMAGTSKDKILEIHGTARETLCLECGDIRSWKEVYARLEQGEKIPLCKKCGGLIKPNTISFGQNLNPKVLMQAQIWSETCDLMIAIGSTLVVEPAASMPRIAKQSGARLVIITLSETPLDHYSDLKIEAKASGILKEVI